MSQLRAARHQQHMPPGTALDLRDERLVQSTLVTWGSAAALAIIGCVIWALPTSVSVFDVTSAVTGLIGLINLYTLARWPARIRMCNLYATSILLSYGLANVIFLVGSHNLTPSDTQLWYQYGLTFDQFGLSHALLLCILAATALLAASVVERPTIWPNTFSELVEPKSNRIVWLGTFVVTLAVASGRLQANATTGNTTTGHQSILGSLALIVLSGLVPYTALMVLRQQPRASRAALVACLVISAATLLLLDRRYMLFIALLTVVAIRIRASWLRKGRFGSPLTIVAVAIIVYLGFEFIVALKLAETAQPAGTHLGLVGAVKAAFSVMFSGGNDVASATSQVATGNDSNSSRPFILAYFGGLVDIRSPMMAGREAWYSLQLAMPSALFPGKLAQLPTAVEAITHPLYGIPVFNGPHTDLVAGYDDFGDIGAIVYPLAAVCLYRGFYALVNRFVRRIDIKLFVWLCLLFQILFIQHNLVSDFVTLRDLVIIGAGVGIVMLLPSWTPRRAPRPTGAHSELALPTGSQRSR